jgi:hypothetical protein
MPYPVCPSCGGRLSFGQLAYRAPFRCPLCGASTEVARYYQPLGLGLSVAMTLALTTFLLGGRGIWILAGFVALLLPVMAIQIFLTRALFRVPLRVHREDLKPLIGSSLGLDERGQEKRKRRQK